jgi:hypothetical protein
LKNLGSLKGAADNFLTVNYGILPTVGDLQNIYRAFHRVAPFIDSNGFDTYNAMATTSSVSDDITVTVEKRIKIAIDNEDCDFSELARKIDSMGFSLTLSNLWDLVPYSFAIDWFVNVGDFLDRVDTRLRILRLNIQYATMSHKETRSCYLLPSLNAPIYGQFSQVLYTRWTSDQCPVPTLLSNNTITATDHWLEAGALLLQRGKH